MKPTLKLKKKGAEIFTTFYDVIGENLLLII